MALARRFRTLLVVAAVVLAAGGGLVAYKMRLPQPQSVFAAGQPAPDFTLNDQDGHPFHLAAQRGNGVLLIFYRGYW